MQTAKQAFLTAISGLERSASVPEVNAKDLNQHSFTEEWVAHNTPCVIRGAVKHWPAVDKWKNKAYWKERCENFGVSIYPHHNFVQKERQHQDREQISFQDALDRLFQENEKIVSMPSEEINSFSRFHRIEEDMHGFTFLPRSEHPRVYNRQRLFMYRKAASSWHYHSIDETLMCQVNGPKRVILLPPDIPSPAKVVRFLDGERYLDGEQLDPSIELKSYITVVNEGDALYIPPYWYHLVLPDDDNVGFTVAYCWSSPLHKLGDFSNYYVRDLYKQAVWPLNKWTILAPFLALYAAVKYLFFSIRHRPVHSL